MGQILGGGFQGHYCIGLRPEAGLDRVLEVSDPLLPVVALTLVVPVPALLVALVRSELDM